VSLNINLFTPAQSGSEASGSSMNAVAAFPPTAPGTVACPGCGGNVAPIGAGWQRCPYCEKRLQIRLWPVARHRTNAAAAMPDQATCFFHPEKAFQTCCQRCGRFVCALCDLQLGAEHVCPTCFERGRAETRLGDNKAEWRHRDVLYDSIALTVGWGWIIFWPVIVAAIPAAIVLHVKFRKAPHSYLLPRSAWRFWVAYAGFVWLPLLLAGLLLIPRWMVGRH
jgi:hypothetical protein